MGPVIEVAAGPWTQQQVEGQDTRDPPAPGGAERGLRPKPSGTGHPR